MFLQLTPCLDIIWQIAKIAIPIDDSWGKLQRIHLAYLLIVQWYLHQFRRHTADTVRWHLLLISLRLHIEGSCWVHWWLGNGGIANRRFSLANWDTSWTALLTRLKRSLRICGTLRIRHSLALLLLSLVHCYQPFISFVLGHGH